MDNHRGRPEIKTAFSGRTGSSVRFSKTLGQTMLYVAIPIQFAPPMPPGALRLSMPATSIDLVLSSIRKKILLGSLLVIILAAYLSLYAARRISRPLEEMKQAAQRLGGGALEQPIRIKNKNMSVEMTALAGALNRMADEINRRIRIIVRQRNELEAVFAIMAEPIIAVDAEERIIRMNRAATSLFMLDPKAVKGKAMQGVIRNSVLRELISRSLWDNTSLEEEIFLFEGTSRIILQTHAVPLRNGDRKNMGALVVMNDLTRIKRLEKIRQDFVANVSHEIKTPLTAIKGYVETLLDGALDNSDDAARFLEIVARQTARLDAIVDDLLTLSRIENKADKGEIMLNEGKILPVFNAAYQTCAVNAEKKKINVRIQCSDALAAPMNSPLLEQAIINLLTNAITYGPGGSTVTLRAEHQKTPEDREIVRINVEDQGPGIEREHLGRLFERFYRCDKARGRKQGGTGLGLAIVKHIAQSHGGSVSVRSNPGRGSVFTISLPVSER